MAHFAELNADNKVLRVIVVGNPDCLDESGNESEQVGIEFCQSLFGSNTTWVQTSYNGNTRGKFAGIGDTYDAKRDVFLAPQPFPSWVLNDDTLEWVPPIPMPEDDQLYQWDESAGDWVLS